MNPDHLFLGTVADNSADMIKKGRSKFPKKGHLLGEANHRAKLSLLQVKEIKIKIKQGMTCINIAKEYNVSRLAISSIKNNSSWKHVVIEE